LSRLRNARWVGAGLLDQVVMAGANAANTLLGPILIQRDRAGIMLLSLGVGYLAMYLNRAFVGDVLIAMASRYEGERRDRLIRNGISAAGVSGLLGLVVFVVIWLAWPRGGNTDLRDLIWIAPFLPAIMAHDTGRCTYLADRKPEKALVIDLIWTGTQAVLVTAMVLTDTVTPAGLLAAWGFGAVVGSLVFWGREQQRPWAGNPRAWLSETRHLSGWFTATAVIGQFQLQAVNFLVGFRLSSGNISGLRFVQAIVMQPIQNFITAVQALIVPRASRKAADATRRPGAAGRAAAADLRRITRQLGLAFVVLGVLFVLVVWPVVSYALAHTHKWHDVAGLALPISMQGALYLIQVPFTAAIRAMHRAKLLFAQYLVFTTVCLTGLVIGTAHGLEGAVWGLFTGTATGLACMIAMYLVAVRSLTAASGQAEAEPETDDDVEPVEVV
jgi:O-antigen/teichoic acid export membrane protein